MITYQSDLAISYNNLGRAELAGKDALQALTRFQQAEKLLSRLQKAAPEDASFTSSLGGVLFNKGEALSELGREPEARDAWQNGLQYQRQAAQTAPDVVQYRKLLASQQAAWQKRFNSTTESRLNESVPPP